MSLQLAYRIRLADKPVSSVFLRISFSCIQLLDKQHCIHSLSFHLSQIDTWLCSPMHSPMKTSFPPPIRYIEPLLDNWDTSGVGIEDTI